MAGGTITRVSSGSSIKEIEENYTIHTEYFTMNSGGKGYFSSDKEILIADPKKPKPVGKYFKRGWWTDENDKPIKEALIGQKVKFHIEMEKEKVPTGSTINFTLKDWDGMFNINDSIKIYSAQKDPKTDAYPEVKEMKTDGNGKSSILINLTENLVQLINDDGGNEIELYFACSYYNKNDKETEQLDLPAEEFNYLVVYEKEVLITVLVELPHSKETGVGAKGLAGHSAMAIGDRYFDYGPDYYTSTIIEQKYDYDFNDDGDKDDTMYVKREKILDSHGNDTGQKRPIMYDDTGKISDIDYKFSPGRPWWGEMVAERLNINANNVKLKNVLDFINLDWYDDETNIYGKVHKVEFYVKESEARKISEWWIERYKHLKAYSVLPWNGEQCTTTVKTAIKQIFTVLDGENWIPDMTQTPKGLLEDLQSFISTSKQHNEELAKITIIKQEDSNWPNP